MKADDIMKQAQQLQKKLKKQQEELAMRVYEASSGGGMVTARANGMGEVLSVVIDPEVVTKDDIAMLQDLVVAAVNEVLKRIHEDQQDEMAGMMGGLGLKIPGIS